MIGVCFSKYSSTTPSDDRDRFFRIASRSAATRAKASRQLSSVPLDMLFSKTASSKARRLIVGNLQFHATEKGESDLSVVNVGGALDELDEVLTGVSGKEGTTAAEIIATMVIPTGPWKEKAIVRKQLKHLH